jgi:hypothetical protein
MSVLKVFARCNGGHYFAGGQCPFDGWSSEETNAIAPAAQRFVDEGRDPSMTALEASGLSPQALARACVVEFYSTDHAVDGIQPELIVIAGRAYTLKDAPAHFK